MKGIGFTDVSSNSKNIFHPFVKKNEFIMSDYKSQHLVKYHNQHSNAYSIVYWVCRYCARRGQIQSYCYKLYGRPLYHYQSHPIWKAPNNAFPQQIWRSKAETRSHIAYTSMRVSSPEDWYVSSDWPRHTTRENNYLEDIKLYANSKVTFGDKSIGKREVILPWSPMSEWCASNRGSQC